ncbi:MAG: lysophospholipid acyltransferase family protein [Methylobacter sp.]
MYTIIIYVITPVLFALIFWFYLRPAWLRIKKKIQQVCTCGYLPPPPSKKELIIMKIVSNFVVWLQVGKVRVSGIENISCDLPKIIIPNHSHYLDPFVIGISVSENIRYMAAKGLLEVGGGLGGLIFSRYGAFCTDLRPGEGGPALRSAIQILKSDQTLLMFPEGWANMDGVMRPFKEGMITVAKGACVKSGKKIHIIPAHLRYGKYVNSKIRLLPITAQCLILLFGFPYFRRGVYVCFGKPNLVDELSKDRSIATSYIQNVVKKLGDKCIQSFS